jgi:ATP-dependent RNA helicase HrpB
MNRPSPAPLPIDPLLPEITAALERHRNAVVAAQPGAGKTTRVPPALLEAPFTRDREIWVLQPRRLAAKMAALRVAGERGEEAGDSVGYHFRFEKRLGPGTRLRFLTDGMLLPLAQADPSLSRVAAVVLDEFHERSLALELGLGWLKKLQSGPRPDLRLLVMSATLDTAVLSSYLGDCPVFTHEGRAFPVSVEYHPFPAQPDLAGKVRSAVKLLVSRNIRGTLLVFLPGQAEIRRCRQVLSGEGLEVESLYGDLSVEEQQKALAPSGGTKVVLSTNLAETSLTVPGVTAVVDSGLTRQSRVSSWSGLPGLVTVPASQASAAQRTGRAGRLQEGVCLRLYTSYDFGRRAAFDLPELQRSDLSKSLLDLKSMGLEQWGDFPWFQEPAPAVLQAGLGLLRSLGALDGRDRLTGLGKRMARFPLGPRLSRFLLQAGEWAGEDGGLSGWACRLAALVSEEKSQSEDLLEELRGFKPGFESGRLEGQLAGLLGHSPAGPKGKGLPDLSPSRTALLSKALLSAFPDRVAQVRPENPKELLLCAGGTLASPDSGLTRAHAYFTVVEAQELSQGDKNLVKARSLCPIEMDWLLDLFPEGLKEEKNIRWNAKAQRVEGSRRLRYGQLVLDEKPLARGELGPEGAEILYREALSAGAQAYCDPEELSGFLNRVRFTAESRKGFSGLPEKAAEETLRELCGGSRSFGDLKDAGLAAALRSRLAPADRGLLDQWAPPSVALPSGRKMEVHYDAGKPPWGESRIQDFFGMKKGPTVAGGSVRVVLHLLSPARRPVQVTDDLEGFWEKHYPDIRREFSRRYPRHPWPEKPC